MRLTTLLQSGGWLLLPLACHIGFSWIGFSPTDDGWMQAIARRILDGHMPYRDFILIFPALSIFLQVPLLLVGGDHVLWLSRLWGWATIGATCWIWSGVIFRPAVPLMLRYALYCGACLLCAHTFPVQAWHSLDGMLLASLAVLLANRGTRGGLRMAFVFAGLAGLCRQNFAVFPLLLLLAIDHTYKWRAVFWTALAPALYAAVPLLTGCFREFIHQVTATGGSFFQVAGMRYLHTPGFLWAIPAGMAAARLLGHRKGTQIAVPTILLAAGAYASVCLWLGPDAYHDYTFRLFGFVVGLALIAARRGLTSKDRLVLVSGLGLTWTVAISIGYNSPALMSGVLWCLLWRVTDLLASTENPPKILLAGQIVPVVLLISLMGLGTGFWRARQQFPYRDRAAAELRWDVGDVLPGAAGLRTNALTYATMAELQSLAGRFESEHRRYGILTDCSAYWVRSPSGNPLPCEWPQETALGYDPALFRQFFTAMQQLPASSRLIVQKYLISEYAWTLSPVPLDWSYYFAQNWVRRNCHKLEETQFFEVYLPPGGSGN